MTTPRFDGSEVTAALGEATATFLGSGAFGDTWRVDDRAIKIICVDGYPPVRVAREVAGLSLAEFEAPTSFNFSILEPWCWAARAFLRSCSSILQQAIDRGARPSAAEAAALLGGLLVGIDALHGADGTVHRDIKPANIALRNGLWDEPVLLGLGLARSNTETTVTMYPGLIGTTAFMAPEQLRGQRARKAADLFAISVSVRAAIVGRHPFYEPGSNYTIDEAIAKIDAGPKALPPKISEPVRQTLDRLVRPAEYERGSATSNLRRLERTP